MVTLILLRVLHSAWHRDSSSHPAIIERVKKETKKKQKTRGTKKETLDWSRLRHWLYLFSVMSLVAPNRNKQRDHPSSFLSLSESGVAQMHFSLVKHKIIQKTL